MDHVIALKGTPSEKKVGPSYQMLIPFVGATPNPDSEMGIGLMFPEGTVIRFFWGMGDPHLLIRSWYGMQFLQRIQEVNPGILSACWYAADRKLSIEDDDDYDLTPLELTLGRAQIQPMRDEILAMTPDPDTLDRMITTFRDARIAIDADEINLELKAGRITKTPVIDSFLGEAEEAAKQHERRMAAIFGRDTPP